jgi:hypothetical protein
MQFDVPCAHCGDDTHRTEHCVPRLLEIQIELLKKIAFPLVKFEGSVAVGKPVEVGGVRTTVARSQERGRK